MHSLPTKEENNGRQLKEINRIEGTDESRLQALERTYESQEKLISQQLKEFNRLKTSIAVKDKLIAECKKTNAQMEALISETKKEISELQKERTRQSNKRNYSEMMLQTEHLVKH